MGRLPYLEGLQGLAALYVVAYHSYAEVAQRTGGMPLSAGIQRLTGWLGFGQLAVDVFIVLSGYCLMLPVAQSGGELAGGWRSYLFRRARRILPPYYLAMAVCLAVILCVPGMGKLQGSNWDRAIPPDIPHTLLLHTFLVHNLRSSWMYQIDPPMWSVATEFQIYLLFPLLLLPVWRRFGAWAVPVLGLVVGFAPYYLGWMPQQSSPWFLGLFGLGMLAATVNTSAPKPPEVLERWGAAVAAVAAISTIIALAARPEWCLSHLYLIDSIAGTGVAGLLVAGTEATRRGGKGPLLLRISTSRPLLALGPCSYSLYLTHYPVLSFLYLQVRPHQQSADVLLLVLLSAGTLASLAVAAGFYWLCERHFVNIRKAARP